MVNVKYLVFHEDVTDVVVTGRGHSGRELVRQRIGKRGFERSASEGLKASEKELDLELKP